MGTHLHFERFDAREWPDAQMEALFADGFPAFIVADREVKLYLDRVREWFAHLDIVLVDDDVPVANGWGVPIRWNGEVDALPTGYTDALRLAVELREKGGSPDTFVICAGIVHPERKGGGIANELIDALAALAEQEGWRRVIAPVRPTLKHRYPLIPIEEYASWVRADGLPFDPWLRLHVRLGGRILAAAPFSQTMSGTVAEWESWSELPMPTTGDYVIPAGLSVLHIDRDADIGNYIEPNVWVRHR
jgi:GNAT superfamily N-acetyltransferase